MPLFKSLSNITQSNDVSSKDKSLTTISKPAFPATAIQVYSTKYIHFLSNTVQNYDHAYASSSSNNSNNRSESHSQNRNKELKSLPKEYELLTYQPVYVPDHDLSLDSNSQSKEGTATNSTTLNNNIPNLGIWDCRCHIPQNTHIVHSSSISDSDNQIISNNAPLLKSALYQYNHQSNDDYNSINNNNSKPTFIATIDLEYNIENVYSTLQSMMLSILQSIDHQRQQQNVDKDSNDASSLLKPLLQFGYAPSTTMLMIHDDQKQSLTQLNLIICVILPSKKEHNENENNNMTYKEKQGLNLVLYHLFKYANDLNCTLCFLKNDDIIDDGGDSNSQGNNTSMNGISMSHENGESNNVHHSNGGGIVPQGLNVQQFAQIIKGISTNDDDILLKYKKIYEGKSNDIDSNDVHLQSQELQHHQPSIYFPNEYDVDLIDSVYLRSASCAGVWDANTDNLWDALSLSSLSASNSNKISTINEENEKARGGNSSNSEEEWLSKLADSVSAYTNSSFGVSNNSIDGSKSVSLSAAGAASDDTSMKSSTNRTTTSSNSIGKVKDSNSISGTVASKSSKRVVKKKPASGAASKKSDGKDNVSDFFNDLLKS